MSLHLRSIRLRSMHAIVVPVAAAVALAACGGTSAPGSSSPTAGTTQEAGSASSAGGGGQSGGPLACDVVTADMIQAALGVAAGTGAQETFEIGGSTCDFKAIGVGVRVFPDRDAKFLASMKGNFSGAVDLPGVGDGAWYSQQNATFMVLKGTTVVEVQAPNQNDQAKLAALAAAIAAKL